MAKAPKRTETKDRKAAATPVKVTKATRPTKKTKAISGKIATPTKPIPPSAPSVPAAPKVPKASDKPDAPVAPQTPKASRTPHAPQAPNAAQALDVPEVFKAPKGLRILMVSPEATPFSKTGGLADVSTSLSRALGKLGHDVTLFTPRYRGVSVDNGERRDSVRAMVAEHVFEADLFEVPLGPCSRAMLIDCPPLYDRSDLYAEDNSDYGDNPIRFAFLAIAALEWASAQQKPPAIIHGHDWQAGLLPVYARRFGPESVSAGSMLLHEVPSLFTIHNLACQGVFDKSWVPRLGLGWDDFHINGLEFWDHLSFLKAGIMFSDGLTTVSPTYAEEVQRPEHGYGFDGILRARSSALTGILNGIDVDVWDPSRDPFLPAHYSVDDLSGKGKNKLALLAEFGMSTDSDATRRPIVGIVSRLTEQKGFDLLASIVTELPQLEATFIVVGTGDPHYEQMWRSLAAARPDRIAAFIGFDERRAHLVEAGADLFLMPSRYEPCGLNQMYSMRYGSVPVVRAVGGLVDTVKPYNPRNGHGTGFLFVDYDPDELLGALSRAIAAYHQPRAWRRLQLNGMKKDFSWNRSAAEYLKVYKRVIAARRKS